MEGETPPFWKVVRPPGAAQTPKIYDLRTVKKSYIRNPRETALELVSGAGFWFKFKREAGPVDLRGSPAARGPRPPTPPKIDDLRLVKKSYIENHQETALDLASRADFWCKFICGAGPVDLRGCPAARAPSSVAAKPIPKPC